MATKESPSYESKFRLHILPELGELTPDRIDRDRVKQFVAHLVKKTHSRVVKVKSKDATGKTVITENHDDCRIHSCPPRHPSESMGRVARRLMSVAISIPAL
jgi:hypothetical protein